MEKQKKQIHKTNAERGIIGMNPVVKRVGATLLLCTKAGGCNQCEYGKASHRDCMQYLMLDTIDCLRYLVARVRTESKQISTLTAELEAMRDERNNTP